MHPLYAIGAYVASSQIVPALLPLEHQRLYANVQPSLTWGITASLLAAAHPYVFCMAALPHAAVAALSLTALGTDHSLGQQLLYGPAIASIVAWLTRTAHNPSTSCVVAVTLMHIVGILVAGVATMLYPAPLVVNFFDVAAARRAIDKDPAIRRLRVPVIGAPSILLDGVAVHPTTGSPRFGKKKYMLYCGGNGELFEGTFGALANLADRMQVVVVSVNPKGVGSSGGTTRGMHDLVLDARSVVEHILANQDGALHDKRDPSTAYSTDGQRLQPRDIVVFGHSIGGGVASHLVAKHYPQMGLVLDRTFSTLDDAALSLSPIGKRTALVRAALRLSGFGGVDNVAHFESIPHKRKLVTFHRKDQIIRYADASIARLPQFASAGAPLGHLVVELTSTLCPDPHNAGITELQGFDDVLKRIHSFYERTLSD